MNGSITAGAMAAVAQRRPARVGQAALGDCDMLGADGAFQHLQHRVMRAGQLLHQHRHVGEVARHLQLLLEGEDRLRRDRGAQGRDLAGPRAALQPVDARPFADIVGIGLGRIEQRLLQPRHHRLLGAVALAIGIGRGESHIEPGLLEQPLLDADDHRQIEDRIVGGDLDQRLVRHVVPPG